MDGWSYTLAGFGDFLELRRVTFAEPMPATRVCGVCGLLPSLTRHLPCGHVLCDLCVAQIVKCEGCPFDGRKFALADVRSIAFERSELDQCRVHCTACDGSTGSGNQCDFAGKLSELGLTCPFAVTARPSAESVIDQSFVAWPCTTIGSARARQFSGERRR